MKQTYLVRRRYVAASANGLDAALTRLRAFEDHPTVARVRWLHSYALRESEGGFGLACVLEADSALALRHHAQATGLPAAEILPVVESRRVRPFAPTLVFMVRREQAWADGLELERRASDGSMAGRVSWLQSYLVREDADALGSCCLYQAIDAQALRQHAKRAGLPANEITQVLGRIVFRHGREGEPAASNAAPA